MPAILLIGDSDTPGRHTMTSGSPNVFANGRGVCRDGDQDSNNDAVIASGGSVYVNGVPIALDGDHDTNIPADIENGTSTVIVGR